MAVHLHSSVRHGSSDSRHRKSPKETSGDNSKCSNTPRQRAAPAALRQRQQAAVGEVSVGFLCQAPFEGECSDNWDLALTKWKRTSCTSPARQLPAGQHREQVAGPQGLRREAGRAVQHGRSRWEWEEMRLHLTFPVLVSHRQASQAGIRASSCMLCAPILKQGTAAHLAGIWLLQHSASGTLLVRRCGGRRLATANRGSSLRALLTFEGIRGDWISSRRH